MIYFSFQNGIFYLNFCLKKCCYPEPRAGTGQDWTGSTTLLSRQGEDSKDKTDASKTQSDSAQC